MPILLEVSSIGQKCVKEKKNLCTGSSSRFEIGFWEATFAAEITRWSETKGRRLFVVISISPESLRPSKLHLA
jgi:hypothetical protein